MAALARILGAWMFIRNPNRSTNQDLLLMAGGVIVLNREAIDKLGESLMTIRVNVWDEDNWSSDDLLITNQSLQLGPAFLHDALLPKCFHVDGIVVPHQTLNSTDPFYTNKTDVYCKILASGGGVTTNEAKSNSESVKVD
jgi:hypothetical protein